MNDRTIYNIVWSCLTTIFSCTWIAIHPNVPAAGEHPLLRRLKIFALALVAPELIVLWSLRQWLSSRRLARKYKEFGWTQTHGFFAIMGGFQVRVRGEHGTTVLDPEDFGPLLRTWDIAITEKEIWDKSKGDALAKTLVVIQITWFLVQFVTRLAHRLAITELEVVTVAFAAHNLMIYFCWWNKPLDVTCPIVITISRAPRHRTFIVNDQVPHVRHHNSNRLLSKNVSCSEGDEDMSLPPSSPTQSQADSDRDSTSISSFCRSSIEHWAFMSKSEDNILQSLSKSPRSFRRVNSLPLFHQYPLESIARTPVEFRSLPNPLQSQPMDSPFFGASLPSLPPLSSYDQTGSPKPVDFESAWHRFWFTPSRPRHLHLSGWRRLPIKFTRAIQRLTQEFRNMAARTSTTYSHGKLRDGEATIAEVFTCGLAVLFDCLCWFSDFPSNGERMLWRVSSIIITCVPVVTFTTMHAWAYLWSCAQKYRVYFTSDSFKAYYVWTILLVCFSGSQAIYILARMSLLAQMFVALRNPGQGVYQNVNWVSYIPHF